MVFTSARVNKMSYFQKISSSLRKWTLIGAGSSKENSEEVVLVEMKDLGVQNETSAISGKSQPSTTSRCSRHPYYYLYTVIFFTVIGGFLYGYDTGVIAGALLALDEDFNYDLDATQKELLVSVTVAAAILGALAGALSNEWLGRRPTIVIASAIYTIGAVIMSVAPINTYGWLIVLTGRLIVGIGIGLSSMTVPIYLAECSPAHQRGRVTMVDVLAVTGGQFVAAAIDYAFSFVAQGWRYMLGLAAIPAVIRMVAFFFLPESPRWLVGKGKTERARKVLEDLTGSDSVERELEQIAKNIESTAVENEKNPAQKLWFMLTHRHLLTALVVGCGLQAIQQLSGVNTIVYYSPTILRMAGAVDDHLAIGLGAVVALSNLIFTLVGLCFIERLGRRRLILASMAGVIFSLVLLGSGFSFTHTSSKPACPTDKCLWRDCEECVIEDDCYFCNFPYSAIYGGAGASGFCINRNWTAVDEATDQDYCWVPEVVLYPDTNSDDHCSNLSYVTPGYGPPSPASVDPGSATGSGSGTSPAPPPPTDDYLQLRGSIFPFCPSKFLWIVLVALIFYSVTFAPGMRPVPWTVNAEIYPNWARSVGNAASTATNWLCNLLVSVTFLHTTHYLNPYGTFFLYAGLAIGGFVFILLMLPETKGKSLEEVEDLFCRPPCPPPGLADDTKPLYETLDS